MILTYDYFQDLFTRKGYKWYPDNINLIGIRSSIQAPNIFNDLFVVAFKVPIMPNSFLNRVDVQQHFLNVFGYRDLDGNILKEDGKMGANTLFALNKYKTEINTKKLMVFPITTDPGTYWLNYPMNTLGTAIIVPGQYIDAYQIGYHKQDTSHRALVQTGAKITVYRDNDKDSFPETTIKTESGFFGMNIHRARAIGETITIDKFSAGCNVFARANDLAAVLELCGFWKVVNNNLYTYTVLDEKTDLK